MSGRGAWTTVGKPNGLRQYQYVYGMPLDGSSKEKSAAHYAVNLGVKAIQNQLNKLRSTSGLLVEDGLFGRKTSDAVRAAQSSWGHRVDGVAGTVFCSHLWRPLIQSAATNAGIDPKYLYGQMMHESSADPGACGYFHEPDRGLVQINTEAHKSISVEMAHDPTYALPYSARRLKSNFDKYAGKGMTLQVHCMILQHNSPAGADTLYRTGNFGTAAAQSYVEKVLMHAEEW